MSAFEPPTRNGAARPAHILVAEDELPIREFVARALALEGHEVDTVEDGLQALDALAQRSYDLLLTDIVMPGLDGIELALKATKDFPQMTVVLMTGYAQERQRAYGLEMLIHSVISKPFSLRQICDVVRAALAAGPGG